MSKERLKNGRADGKSLEDIAKLHGVSLESIKKEFEIGLKIEREHTDSKEEQGEIVKDHLVEDPKYYTDPDTGLIAKEKKFDKKEKMNEETKKMMSLAGIQEDDKKFLQNESFQENNRIPDPFFDGVIKIKNKETEEYEDLSESKDDSDFTVLKFEQRKVEPNEDDESLYTLGQTKK